MWDDAIDNVPEAVEYISLETPPCFSFSSTYEFGYNPSLRFVVATTLKLFSGNHWLSFDYRCVTMPMIKLSLKRIWCPLQFYEKAALIAWEAYGPKILKWLSVNRHPRRHFYAIPVKQYTRYIFLNATGAYNFFVLKRWLIPISHLSHKIHLV